MIISAENTLISLKMTTNVVVDKLTESLVVQSDNKVIDIQLPSG
jgi:hypothetical protein